MDLRLTQTIAALASPPGSSERGIVRISGDHVRAVLAGWFHPDETDCWNAAKTARQHHGTLNLDETLRIPVSALLWPNRRSYTGQPLVELQLPGSPCLLEHVLQEAYRRGARPARPGEFTMRAFLAGKVDLLQAEAVLGVIDASDHVELQAALGQLAGGISHQFQRLRTDLLELLADLEAGLDFIEEDIEFVSRREVSERLSAGRRVVETALEQSQDRTQSRVRPRIILAGLPNAGKSTLFNFLTGKASALVSAVEGTTRDFLVHPVSRDGFSFDLVDTAGWESDHSGIGSIAQQLRGDQVSSSDVVVWCSARSLTNAERELDDRLWADVQLTAALAIRVLTKSDLDPLTSAQTLRGDSGFPAAQAQVIAISALTGAGIDQLLDVIRSQWSSGSGKRSQWLGMTAARCRQTLESLKMVLARAEQAAQSDVVGDEILAVELREALDLLGSVLGTVYTDDILDRVFSKFCIGK